MLDACLADHFGTSFACLCDILLFHKKRGAGIGLSLSVGTGIRVIWAFTKRYNMGSRGVYLYYLAFRFPICKDMRLAAVGTTKLKFTGLKRDHCMFCDLQKGNDSRAMPTQLGRGV